MTEPVGALQQPEPLEAGGPVIHDLLIRDLEARFPGRPGLADVVSDVRDRLEFGLRKYGKPLRAHNGRNPLLDAYQEILDSLAYFTQAMVETEVRSPPDAAWLALLTQMYDTAVEMAFSLREELSDGR